MSESRVPSCMTYRCTYNAREIRWRAAQSRGGGERGGEEGGRREGGAWCRGGSTWGREGGVRR